MRESVLLVGVSAYTEVVEKGACGPGLQCMSNLQFVVSGGIVKDTPLDGGESWTLGGYVEGIGGQNVRGKKTFGIYVPDSDDKEDEEEVSCTYAPLHIFHRTLKISYSHQGRSSSQHIPSHFTVSIATSTITCKMHCYRYEFISRRIHHIT